MVNAPFVRLTAITRLLGNSPVTITTRGYTSRRSNTCANRISTTVITSANTACYVIKRSRHHTCCNRGCSVLHRGIHLTLTGGLHPVFYINRIGRRHRTNHRGRIIHRRLRNSMFGLATRRFNGLIVTCRPI